MPHRSEERSGWNSLLPADESSIWFDWISILCCFLAEDKPDSVQQCRFGDQPSATKQQEDRRHLRRTARLLREIHSVCKEISGEHKWWRASVAKFWEDFEEYKAETNRAVVCFPKSMRFQKKDLGNWLYNVIYYYVAKENPLLVAELSCKLESLQANRGPTTRTALVNKGDVIESGVRRAQMIGFVNAWMMQKFCRFANLMHDLEMQLARSPILTRSSADTWSNWQRPDPEALAYAIERCCEFDKLKRLHAYEFHDTSLLEAHRAVQSLCMTSTPLKATHPWVTMGSACQRHLHWQMYRDPKTGSLWWHHEPTGQCRWDPTAYCFS